MRVLLDTHAFLWFVTGDRRLSRPALRALEKKGDEIFLSAASVWEIAIKASLARLVLPAPVREYVAEKMEQGLRLLPVEWSHAAAVEKLPFHHRDPFDRLLVAQALAESMPMVTGDRTFRAYGVEVIW
ncbi:MAG: type II toxin-antitoxin system VapC family toxin [Nitrospirae bacterium]|nr:type II toxin-antitoxin system VapC family toxin [Nitrospirota bacterium]MBI2150828.1 type II toxin-antitoxin system VapC family toxin [Acidobacteriota bacterium]